MSFKNKPERKSEYNTDKVRVRNSYYTFSKEYPSKNILHRRKGVRKRLVRSRIVKAFVCTVCFVLIALCAYFVSDLSLKISYKPYDTSVTSDNKEGSLSSADLLSDGVRAWYLPSAKLSDKDYLKSFASYVKRKDGNAVLIDFKDENGKLCYSSDNENAILSKAALYDNETVRNAVSFFKSKNLNVIARIYCFQDNTVTAGNSSLAIMYLDSDVNWLDEEGKAWLNPFSKQAKNYLYDIIEETMAFSVDGILLEAVSFPYEGATDTLGYPGRKDSDSRNSTLKSFISAVKKKLPENKLLFVSLSASDAVKGSDLKYEGSLSENAADGTAVYISESPEGYTVDKKSKYVSLLSLLSKVSSSLSDNKETVPVIESEDYTYSLKQTLMKNGYRSYIVLNS